MFGLDSWFGDLNLTVKSMINGRQNVQPEADDDNGQKLEREIQRFEGEGGLPSGPQPLEP